MECSQAQLVDSWQVECSRPSPGQGRQHLPLNWNLAMNLDSKLLLSPLHTCEHSTFWSNESCNNFLIDFCQLVSNYQILSSFWGANSGLTINPKEKINLNSFCYISYLIFLLEPCSWQMIFRAQGCPKNKNGSFVLFVNLQMLFNVGSSILQYFCFCTVSAPRSKQFPDILSLNGI